MHFTVVVGLRVAAIVVLVGQCSQQGFASASLPLPSGSVAPVSTEGGGVFAWGNLRSGALQPPEVLARGIASIAAGESHALALKLNGQVLAWGRPEWGGADVPLDALSSVTQIAASGETSIALRADGRAVVWTGRAGSGPTYVPDEARSDVVSIAAGYSSAFAIRADGELVAWGMPDAIVNQVANGTPMQGVPGGGINGIPSEAKTKAVAVAAGVRHALALTSAGKVLVWGYNDREQLAVPPEAREGIVAISAGYYHSLALTSSGRVIAWGSNEFGQTTVPVQAHTGIMAISAGDDFSIALTSSGRVVTWGGSRLGPGDTPARVESGVTQIAAGSSYGLALKVGGTVTAPGSVANLKSTPATGFIRVTWSPPTDLGGATMVTYQYQVGKGAWKSTPLTSVTVKGKKGLRIMVKVRAVNSVGHGPSVGVSGMPT